MDLALDLFAPLTDPLFLPLIGGLVALVIGVPTLAVGIAVLHSLTPREKRRRIARERRAMEAQEAQEAQKRAREEARRRAIADEEERQREDREILAEMREEQAARDDRIRARAEPNYESVRRWRVLAYLMRWLDDEHPELGVYKNGWLRRPSIEDALKRIQTEKAYGPALEFYPLDGVAISWLEIENAVAMARDRELVEIVGQSLRLTTKGRRCLDHHGGDARDMANEKPNIHIAGAVGQMQTGDASTMANPVVNMGGVQGQQAISSPTDAALVERLVQLVTEMGSTLPEGARRRLERDAAEVEGEMVLPPAEREVGRVRAALESIGNTLPSAAAVATAIADIASRL
ncbi:hypothetical protein [Streptomyces sp. NPDC058401]|uniref:hypothetical protein n=1 Tax=Streptomyces sp. NPDC058401 TaxID=3346480 RepID=UPI003649C4B6